MDNWQFNIFEAQQEFVVLVEDCISKPLNLESEIDCHQTILEKLESKLDLVFGIDLCMTPRNMLLKITEKIGLL